MLYFIAFILSCCIVMLLIPPLRKLAWRIDFVDKPQLNNERKIHRQPIPLTAGIATLHQRHCGIFAVRSG